MKQFNRNQFNNLLRSQGHKAGIVPGENTVNEEYRLAEVKRLGVMDRDLSSESRYSAMTQVASYLTVCAQSSINILGYKMQPSKISYGYDMIQSTLMKEIPREISVCQFCLVNPGKTLIIENIL
mgnify:CR=1 FL=1